jgi:phosphoglucomutase
MNALLASYGAEIFAAIATPVVVYLAALARSYVKASVARMDSFMDEEARARLEAAFDNAIAAAEKAGSAVQLKDVIDYAQRMNPGDLARFDLSGNKLIERAKAAVARRAK